MTMTMTKAHLKEFIARWKEMGANSLNDVLALYNGALDTDVIIEYQEAVPVEESNE